MSTQAGPDALGTGLSFYTGRVAALVPRTPSSAAQTHATETITMNHGNTVAIPQVVAAQPAASVGNAIAE